MTTAVARTARLAAWSAVAAVAFVTLSPIELRPRLAGIRTEHLVAFASIGLLFGLAYPRRFWPTLLTLLTVAALLEAAQHLMPDRHGRWVDFVVKAIGGVVGLGAATASNWGLIRLRRERAAPSTADG